MKIKWKFIMCAVLVAPLLVGGVARAHEEDATQTETPKVETHKTGDEGLTLRQRVDKYKTTNKPLLTAALKTRLKEKCKASQGAAITKLGERIATLQTSREQTLADMQDHRAKLTTKLQEKGIDTAEFDKQTAELKTKSDTYLVDLAKYHEALVDLAGMDCATDPEAFKAALETARTDRLQVVKDGQAVRSYVADTLVPTLKTLHQQAKDKEGQN